jgi:predicted O-linked N-acetylglucosamine transferase (SPINDLY family)
MRADLDGLMAEARRLQQTNPATARQLCLKILQEDGGHFEAQFLLASCHYQMGQLDEALAATLAALDRRPDDPLCLQAYGSLLIEAGRFDDAVTILNRALIGRPNAMPFRFNRALALTFLGRAQEALADFDQVLALQPDFQEAWLARGNLLRQSGRFGEALRDFDKVLESNPGNPNAHHARGLVLRKLGRVDEALWAIDTALAVDRGNAQAWNARGTVLMDQARQTEALAAYNQALDLDRNLTDALVNRGLLQWTQWRRYDEAVADLERAVALAPGHASALGELMHIRMYGGDWRDFARTKEALDQGIRAGRLAVRPFAYQAISDSPADLAACSRIFAGLYPAAAAPVFGQRPPRAKIRIGYLSADFRDHATSYLMAGVYEKHDRAAFEILAFDAGLDDASPIRRRLEAGLDGIIDIANLPDQAAAECIRAAKIDILVNLNGYFGDYRMGVFARRPAPVQVNYLGFPATLGAPYIDYLIADRIVIPEDEHHFYDEKIVYLPDCYQANDDARPRPAQIPSREACGLATNAFVFCNFNQSYKFTPDMFASWMRILGQVPGSALWLLDQLPALQINLRKEAEHAGISGNRILFAPRAPVEQHLARLARADLVLDSLPYNAHTTASDALWMGVPLLTCRGKTFPGRVASSLLTATGMEELIAEDLAAYEGLAVALARNKDRLAALRARLAANRQSCALFDTARFCRHLESAYRWMHARQLREEPPGSFSVAVEPA